MAFPPPAMRQIAFRASGRGAQAQGRICRLARTLLPGSTDQCPGLIRIILDFQWTRSLASALHRSCRIGARVAATANEDGNGYLWGSFNRGDRASRPILRARKHLW